MRVQLFTEPLQECQRAQPTVIGKFGTVRARLNESSIKTQAAS